MTEGKQSYGGEKVNDWLDAVNEVNQDTVESTGPQYPYIQWVNGKPALKQAGGVVWHGGWFMPDAFEKSDSWVIGELTHEDGTSTEGMFARDLTVIIIRIRQRWIVGQQGFPWSQYDQAKAEGKPTGHIQALAIVQGLEHMGPLVLTMKGMACKAFKGSKKGKGVLSEFQRIIIEPANALNKARNVAAKFPYRAFWLTVGPERDAKGNPVFTEVGQRPNSSQVTAPVALLPEKATPEYLKKSFVGMDSLRQLNQYYDDAETWATMWDSPQEAQSSLAPADWGDEDSPF